MNANATCPDPRTNSKDEIQKRINALGKWFHNLDLCGVQTAPDHFLGDYPNQKFQNFAHAIPGDLRGKTVLDIGCNAGFYSLEMKRRGADRVVAIDCDDGYLAQARFAAEIAGITIDFRQLSVYDVAKLGERFDVVIFMGVLYHLRHPLLALDLIHEHVAKDLLVFQSMQRGSDGIHEWAEDYNFNQRWMFEDPAFPRMYFIEKKYSDDPTNWWIPNRACSAAMLRSAGFEIIENPEEEVFICRSRPVADADGTNGAVYPARQEPHD
jgi:tRNA (mo5U34)-methyltransferase